MTNKFVTNSSQREFYFSPIKYFKYFQLCIFPHPSKQKHHVRRILIDSNYKIIEIKESFLNKNDYNKILTNYKVNEYKEIPAYDLSNINIPSGGELNVLQSPILSNINSSSGYAAF